MGNAEGAYNWDDTEPTRALPQTRQGLHWRYVGFQHLFDADYLHKEFRHEENSECPPSSRGTGCAARTGSLPRNSSAGHRNYEDSKEDSMDLADAALLFVEDEAAGEDREEITQR